MSTVLRRMLFALITVFVLAGCGQKGPLYLPDDNEDEEEEALLPQHTHRHA